MITETNGDSLASEPEIKLSSSFLARTLASRLERIAGAGAIHDVLAGAEHVA